MSELNAEQQHILAEIGPIAQTETLAVTDMQVPYAVVVKSVDKSGGKLAFAGEMGRTLVDNCDARVQGYRVPSENNVTRAEGKRLFAAKRNAGHAFNAETIRHGRAGRYDNPGFRFGGFVIGARKQLPARTDLKSRGMHLCAEQEKCCYDKKSHICDFTTNRTWGLIGHA